MGANPIGMEATSQRCVVVTMDAITEKYRDKVTPEYAVAVQAIGFARQLIGQHREQYEALLKSEQDMHSFGGMINPTLYRDMLYSNGFKQQTRLIKAALAFLNEADAVADEVMKGAIHG
jgi:hypothetical protein